MRRKKLQNSKKKKIILFTHCRSSDYSSLNILSSTRGRVYFYPWMLGFTIQLGISKNTVNGNDISLYSLTWLWNTLICYEKSMPHIAAIPSAWAPEHRWNSPGSKLQPIAEPSQEPNLDQPKITVSQQTREGDYKYLLL